MTSSYDFRAIEAKWLPVWRRLDPFAARHRAGQGRQRRYLVDMFSYPSGDLHMGNAEAFCFGDLLARYWFQRGYHVLHPIGWDAFGLPAENAAIRGGAHPAEWTYANIETQAASFRRYAVSVDWSTRLHTCDPDFYRWTQWLFLRLYELGLAYRKASWANWCPTDQTVLANEQVIDGRCERCGSRVTKRELTQWYFRITAYAQRLLDDLALLADGWPERVLAMQRNWIGRTDGVYLDFRIDGRDEPVTVFTTRPDAAPGARWLAVAPESSLAEELCTPECRPAYLSYLEETKQLTEIERLATERERTRVFLGRYAVNPATGDRLPVYAADHVLPDYATGVALEIPDDYQPGGAAMVTGEPAVVYRLRDWLISRQRYWGCPIPIIHCEACGEVPVPVEDLPVRLPDLRGADLAPRGVSPLAAATDWVTVACPKCGGEARRDTDTMDTFVDSSWYFLRYPSPDYQDGPVDPQAMREWLPVDQYVGGAEHATGHLLFARFITKVLYDIGLVPTPEPFTKLLNQGQVINQGRAMSKSLGNGVDLAEQLDRYGVDAVRLAIVFAGPPAEDIDWAEMSPGGAQRFLQRAWRLAGEVTSPVGADPATGDRSLRRATHRTIAEVTELVESYRFNVAVARLMALANTVRRAVDRGCGPADPAVREAVTALAVMLSLVAPYTAEEMWQRLGHQPTVALAGWPAADPALAAVDTVTCVVQVAGKVKDRLAVPPGVTADQLRERALASPAVRAALAGRPADRVIVRPPRLVNIVPAAGG
ncbi:MAG TPA: leucine--tRNA ligase [Natronosporangium sp.]